MPVIDHIDGTNRRIYLHSDTVNAGLRSFDTFYREYRVLRQNTFSLQNYSNFLKAQGNLPKGGGKYTPRYIQLLDNCKIVPFNTSHALYVTFEIITDDGQSGSDCFDRAPLTITTRVDINYEPEAFEVVRVTTGSALTEDEHNKLMAIPNDTLTIDEHEQLMSIPSISSGLTQEEHNHLLSVPLTSGGLTTEEHIKLMAIPLSASTSGNLTQEEHIKLMNLPDDVLSEERAKELMFNRQNTVVDRQIVNYIAGNDVSIVVQYDSDGIPTNEQMSL